MVATARYRSPIRLLFFLMFVLWLAACRTSTIENPDRQRTLFSQALENAARANEGFIRCSNYMNAWLSFADAESKLVPRTLDKDHDIWNANDCAADNFPFLVLTSYFTDQEKYRGVMREMLTNEARLTSRVGSLPDTYSFSKRGFLFDSVSMPRVVFGTTEYIKDGLLPLTEWLGQTPWSERMMTMLDDLDRYVDVAGGFGSKGFGSAPDDEVNGELLQVLSRVYWMTGDERYLEWAIQIAEHFLGPAYPLESDYLRLRDHGCEIISGLCELYVTLHYAHPARKQAMSARLHELLDFILKQARNSDGLFYNALNPETGLPADRNLADTWGYTLNGFYAVYMVDSIQAYRDAVLTVFENLYKYHNYNWENLGADGYADAIEGALNLYNRIPDARALKWIDAEIRVMWSMQDSSHRTNAQRWKGTGIVEGWYGDGNFARTTLMYNLWKSQGSWILPWREDVRLGAVLEHDTLYLVIDARTAWQGKLYFDHKRHAVSMKLPVDWPRINQFPEWFTVSPDVTYELTDVTHSGAQQLTGASLREGVAISLQPGETKKLILVPYRQN